MYQFSIDDKLKKIYQNTEFADVTFVVGKNEERFKAHKLLLSTNSRYFELLFYPKGWRSENHQKFQEVRFSNVQPEVFRAVLEFNYTNTLRIEPKWIYQLINASLILEFPDLYIACLEQLASPTTALRSGGNNSRTQQKESSEEQVIAQSPLAMLFEKITFLEALRLWLSGRSDIGIAEYDLFLLLKKLADFLCKETKREINSQNTLFFLKYLLPSIQLTKMTTPQLKTLGKYELFDFKILFDALCQKTTSSDNNKNNSNNNNNNNNIIENNKPNESSSSNYLTSTVPTSLFLNTTSNVNNNNQNQNQQITKDGSMEIENNPLSLNDNKQILLGNPNTTTHQNSNLRNKIAKPLTKKTIKKEIKLLLLASPIKEASNNNVKKSLLSNGIHNIETINVSETDQKKSLSYSDIKNFDAIFFYTNSLMKEPENVGNLLARFVEDGGGLVVCSCGAMADEFAGQLNGRIIDEPFLPVCKRQFLEKKHLKLGHITEPNHPIMKSVSIFNGGRASYHIDARTVEHGSKVIAFWSDHTILIAEKQRSRTFGKVIVLNLFPVSGKSKFWNQKTDGARLISNSVEYVVTGDVED
ncbi:btb/poz domain-containing [Anaeramoeba flamelloides]|uniref:Btb/poz domain-containing n=1 Tax=Anaeramoeba flamelloides TaxID=1746091 RepID=A0AAV8A159_9EUKA|nr:btb/poz domain-containing [Anaeramoeba flamelloides]